MSDQTKIACPCCRQLTLRERAAFEICQVCYWEDDGQDDVDADAVRGGPNGTLSLAQARLNFRTFSACDRAYLGHVRAPTPAEVPPSAQPRGSTSDSARSESPGDSPASPSQPHHNPR